MLTGPHPGIVTIHDVLESEGSVYIVMEHLPGATLELLHKFPRLSSFEAKVGILIRILEALHYAHGRGVVHRDVKPRNVQVRAHSRFPGHALTPTGVMAIRCKQFHLPDL